MWRKFGVPICWRKAQGIIRGKRCGVKEPWRGCTMAIRGCPLEGNCEDTGPQPFSSLSAVYAFCLS